MFAKVKRSLPTSRSIKDMILITLVVLEPSEIIGKIIVIIIAIFAKNMPTHEKWEHNDNHSIRPHQSIPEVNHLPDGLFDQCANLSFHYQIDQSKKLRLTRRKWSVVCFIQRHFKDILGDTSTLEGF